MNKKHFSLTIFAVAFAMIFGLGVAYAGTASDSYNEVFVGEVNLFGVDEAHNGVAVNLDRDAAPRAEFDTYGLHGSLQS